MSDLGGFVVRGRHEARKKLELKPQGPRGDGPAYYVGPGGKLR